MRRVNRLVAAVVSVLVGTAGFFVLVEATALAFGRASVFTGVHRVPAFAQRFAFGDPVVVAGAVGVALLGLLVLAAQLRRQDRTRRLPSYVPGVHLAATRDAYRALRDAAPPEVRRGVRIPLGLGVDRANRVLLTGFGLALVAAGTTALLAAAGTSGDRWQRDPIEDAAVRGWLVEQRDWLWFAVAGAALVGTLLALWWLVAQLAVRRLGSLELDPHTRLAARPLAAAVRAELEASAGVADARATVRRRRGRTRLFLTVLADEDADLDAVRGAVEDTVVPHARLAAGLPDLQVRVTLDQDPPATDRDRLHGPSYSSEARKPIQ